MIGMNGLAVTVRENFMMNGFDIAFVREVDNGSTQILNIRTGIVQTLQSGTIMTGEAMDECCLFLSAGNAQKLIEALRSHGVRDRKESVDEGRLEKQTEHLRDLQNILRAKGVMK